MSESAEYSMYNFSDLEIDNLIDVEVEIYKYDHFLFYSKKSALKFLELENKDKTRLQSIRFTINITNSLLDYFNRYPVYFNLVFGGYIDSSKPVVFNDISEEYTTLTYLIFSDYCKIRYKRRIKYFLFLKYIKQLKAGKKICLPDFVTIRDIPDQFDEHFEQWYNPNLLSSAYSSSLHTMVYRFHKYFDIWKNDVDLLCIASFLINSEIPFEKYFDDILKKLNYDLTQYVENLIKKHIDKFHLWRDYVDKIKAICIEPNLILEYDLEDLKELDDVDYIYIEESRIIQILNNKIIFNKFKEIPVLSKLLYYSLFLYDISPDKIDIEQLFNDEKSLYHLANVIDDIINYNCKTVMIQLLQILLSNPKLAEKVSKIINLDKSLTS